MRQRAPVDAQWLREQVERLPSLPQSATDELTAICAPSARSHDDDTMTEKSA